MATPDSLYSPEWYRVGALRPLLRRHVKVVRQQFRDETWMVLREPGSNRLFRLTLPAWEVVACFDGTRTVDAIWTSLCERLGDEVPTQGEVVRLLSQLSASDLLQSDVAPDLADLDLRGRDMARKKFLGYFKSPLAIRIPVMDPDALVTATLPLGSWLFSRRGFQAWLLIIFSALFLVALNWRPLTENMLDQVLSTENLVLLAVLYPLLKLVHEFGHGWAVKRWGGETRELGVMFLIFLPTPYVDASSAGFFRDKRQRMAVGFAGLQVELLIAAFATFTWVLVEPGTVRAIAYNLMLIAGVSAILFNGNPLLRFDAYHILSDWLEMPNFGNRANQYIGHLVQKFILRMDVTDPTGSRREAWWLGVYAVTAFIYRMFITFGIVMLVATRFFIFGTMLAFLAIGNAIVMPAWRMLRLVSTESRFAVVRVRAWAVLAATLLFLTAFAVVVPLPSYTVTQGVVWVPESSRIYAGSDGLVVGLPVPAASIVDAGTPVVQLDNPELEAKVQSLGARVEELTMRYRQASAQDPAMLAILREEYERSFVEYEDARTRLAGLTIVAPETGRLALEDRQGLLGHFLTRGTVVGYVVAESEALLRVVVLQDDIDLVRHRTRRVEVRFASEPGSVLPGRMLKEVPEASRQLPSAALTLEGGGELAANPVAEQLESVEPLFQFEVVVPQQKLWRVGERVYVRFVHDAEPLWGRMRREIRRVFLRRLDV